MTALARRGLLGSIAAAAALPASARADHPDRELLDVCAELGRQADEWQRLWELTPNEGPDTPADSDLMRYYNDVWPGHQGGLPARLRQLQASTIEGLRAKAVAILAMDAAGGHFIDCRDDAWDLCRSLVEDVAGPARRLMGGERT